MNAVLFLVVVFALEVGIMIWGFRYQMRKHERPERERGYRGLL